MHTVPFITNILHRTECLVVARWLLLALRIWLGDVRMKLTKRLVEALECDADKPIYVWDASLPGFAVKVLPSGTKRYLVKYRTQGGGRSAGQRWLVIGTHGRSP